MLAFLTIAGLQFLALISPGPDFALISAQALQYGRRIATISALGIALSLCVHVSYCILGFAVVIAHSTLLFDIIKYCGAAYLIYIGVKALLTKARVSGLSANYAPKTLSYFQALRQGFLCNLLNPKAALFFVGLFALVVNPDTPIWVQIGYGLEMFLATFLWFAFVARMITHPRLQKHLIRIQPIVVKFMGLFLIGFGVELALMIHAISGF